MIDLRAIGGNVSCTCFGETLSDVSSLSIGGGSFMPLVEFHEWSDRLRPSSNPPLLGKPFEEIEREAAMSFAKNFLEQKKKQEEEQKRLIENILKMNYPEPKETFTPAAIQEQINRCLCHSQNKLPAVGEPDIGITDLLDLQDSNPFVREGQILGNDSVDSEVPYVDSLYYDQARILVPDSSHPWITGRNERQVDIDANTLFENLGLQRTKQTLNLAGI